MEGCAAGVLAAGAAARCRCLAAWAGVGAAVVAGAVLAAGVAGRVGAGAVLAVWAGALRANSTANAAAVMALSWVARQVSRDRRRSATSRPPSVSPVPPLARRPVAASAGRRPGLAARDSREASPGQRAGQSIVGPFRVRAAGFESVMHGGQHTGKRVKAPPRTAEECPGDWRAGSRPRPGRDVTLRRRDASLTCRTSAQVTISQVSSGYADWRGHVIVCGLHGVGLRIARLLTLSGVPAVVVDDNPDLRLARSLIAWGIPHLTGSSSTAQTLTEAGLAGAEAVICVLDDDLRTLETALLTRELRRRRPGRRAAGQPGGGPGPVPDPGVGAGCGRAVRAVHRRGLPAVRGAGDQAGGGAVRRGPDHRAAGGHPA